ncbi:hypothetical protein [Saccharothrix sp. HUAS TT1]|uniref:hypothetical protein n=1 Tax=unclassified Saccharothrix TaxID=2593673 RepID=UPI00345BFD0A
MRRVVRPQGAERDQRAENIGAVIREARVLLPTPVTPASRNARGRRTASGRAIGRRASYRACARSAINACNASRATSGEGASADRSTRSSTAPVGRFRASGCRVTAVHRSG